MNICTEEDDEEKTVGSGTEFLPPVQAVMGSNLNLGRDASVAVLCPINYSDTGWT